MQSGFWKTKTIQPTRYWNWNIIFLTYSYLASLWEKKKVSNNFYFFNVSVKNQEILAANNLKNVHEKMWNI